MRDTNPAYYENLWATMQPLQGMTSQIRYAAKRVLNGKERYEKVAGIPWQVVGLLHLMESNCNFTRQFLNGERWDQKTTLVPVGLGPWLSWEEAATFAFNRRSKPAKWGIGEIGQYLEKWNGLGYASRGKHSPYLWSFSNHGLYSGKYTSDGKYNPNAISAQVGAMVVLKELGL
jgi:lysozyme family protein